MTTRLISSSVSSPVASAAASHTLRGKLTVAGDSASAATASVSTTPLVENNRHNNERRARERPTDAEGTRGADVSERDTSALMLAASAGRRCAARHCRARQATGHSWGVGLGGLRRRIPSDVSRAARSGACGGNPDRHTGAVYGVNSAGGTRHAIASSLRSDPGSGRGFRRGPGRAGQSQREILGHHGLRRRAEPPGCDSSARASTAVSRWVTSRASSRRW